MNPLTLGTAGHIDHGKTALIRALTGVDTDRLPEERARGISIELGYASLDAARRPAAVRGRRARARAVRAHDGGRRHRDRPVPDDDRRRRRRDAPDPRARGGAPRAGRDHGGGGGDQERSGRPRRGPDRGLRALSRQRGGGRVGPDGSGAGRAAGLARAGRGQRRLARRRGVGGRPAAYRPGVHDPGRGNGGDGNPVVGPDRPGRRARAPPAGPPRPRARRSGARPAGGPGAGRAARGSEPDRHRGGRDRAR